MIFTPQINTLIKRLENFSQREQISGLNGDDFKSLWQKLGVIQPKIDSLDKIWKLWIRSKRGDISAFGDFEEWKDDGEVDTIEEFTDIWTESYPDEVSWHSFVLVEYDSNLYFHLGSINLLQLNLITGELLGFNSFGDHYIDLLNWILQEAENELNKVIGSVNNYNQFVSDNLPLKKRTGKIKRQILWDNFPEYQNFRNELGNENVLRFEEVVKNIDENQILEEITVNDFLSFCEFGYEANNYFKGEIIAAKEKYNAMADFRHGGLLDIDPNCKKAFSEWFNGCSWMGSHPWEVCKGGNSTHISLMVTNRNKGWQIYLAGYYREVETVKFALALYENNIPFILEKKTELLEKVKGTDFVGIVQEGIMPRYCHSLFPKEDNINDFMNPWSDAELAEVVQEYGIWYEEEELQLLKK